MPREMRTTEETTAMQTLSLIDECNGVTEIPWPYPTPEMLDRPDFNAVWNVIKSWDVQVPGAYSGYCGATGNHVRAILDALASVNK